jgi:hypothetical protein
MNWARKQHRHTRSRQTPAAHAAIPATEQAANDSLGEYLSPSSHQIEVQELTLEEFEAILASQPSPA